MLMMAKMGAVSFAGQGESAFPEVTLTAVDFSGVYGYIKPGGFIASSIGGTSGGSLSATLLPGFVIDSIAGNGSTISCYIVGDATSALASVSAIKINGTSYPLVGTPAYESGDNYTVISFTGGQPNSAGTYTVQFV